MVTTDNTNPAYATTRFGDAQQPDTSHTHVNVLDQQPDTCILYIC